MIHMEYYLVVSTIMMFAGIYGRYTDHQKEQAVKHDKRGNDHHK